jgi:hypothetical protein
VEPETRLGQLAVDRALLLLTWYVLLVLTRAALTNGTLSIVRLIVFATKLAPVLTSLLAVVASLLTSIQAVLASLLAPLHAGRLSNSI